MWVFLGILVFGWCLLLLGNFWVVGVVRIVSYFSGFGVYCWLGFFLGLFLLGLWGGVCWVYGGVYLCWVCMVGGRFLGFFW